MRCLLVFLFACTASAEDFYNDYVAQEQDFIKINETKKLREKERRQGLEDFLEQKDALADQKRADLEVYLASKRNNREPAQDIEQQEELERQALRKKSEEAREEFLNQNHAREIAKERARTKFDSKEVRFRENKPWR